MSTTHSKSASPVFGAKLMHAGVTAAHKMAKAQHAIIMRDASTNKCLGATQVLLVVRLINTTQLKSASPVPDAPITHVTSMPQSCM